MRLNPVLRVALAAVLLLAAACGDDADEPAAPEAEPPGQPGQPGGPEVTEPPEQEATTTEPADELEEGTLEVVVTGLEAPWDVAFTPDGRTFVTERDSGRLLELDGDGEATEVRRFDVDPTGEGGLMGLAVSPDYDEDASLYAYLTTTEDNRIVRFEVDGDGEEDILTGIPSARIHNGGVLRFGPDGKLYAGTGDAAQPSLSQDEGSLAGKVLRMEPDGSAPDDNPFGDSLAWSIGHRNVQGLAWDAEGRLFATELGPDVDDEVNLIEPGENHGWPEVTGFARDERYVDPVAVFQPPESSPSGAVIPEGGAWGGDVVLANLRGQRLWRLQLDGPQPVAQDDHLVGDFGRLRNVVQHPSGALWILTSNRDGRGRPVDDDDRIVALVPPPP